MLTDRPTQVRFFRFALVGVASAAVNFGSLAVLKTWTGATTAFSIAFVLATAIHFFLNRHWALESSRVDGTQQAGEYLATVGLSYLSRLVVFKFCHEILSYSVMWSALLAMPLAAVICFSLLNWRVFRR